MNTKLDTSKTASLPQPVVEQLHFLSKQQAVEAMFVSTIIGSNHPCIVVLLNSEAYAAEWQKQKWVKKAYHKHKVTVLFISHSIILSHQHQASLFLNYHTKPEKAIFIEEGVKLKTKSYRKTLKKLKKWKETYFHDQELFLTEAKKAEKEDAILTVFNLFHSLYAHHLFHIEWLLFGSVCSEEDLSQRLLRLSGYSTAISKAFVKKTATSFYLIEVLEYAKRADDCSMLETEFLAAIQENEKLLCETTINLCKQLKNGVKEKVKKQKTLPSKPNYDNPKLLQLFTDQPNIESIYEYNRVEVQQSNQTVRSIRYWFIVGEGISNHQLANWFDTVKKQTKGEIEIIPIAHNRTWIQRRLYMNQLFMQKVMQQEFSIYERDASLAQIHWHVPYTADYPDLWLYCEKCYNLQNAMRLLLVDSQNNNVEAWSLLFSSFIVRTCQVLIYAKWSYYPNNLPISILWRLGELADSNVQRMQYLIHKLSFDWFNFITHHLNPYHTAQFIQESDLSILHEIATEVAKILEAAQKKEQ